MNHIEIGTSDKPLVVFGHGWARTHKDFIPVAEAIAPYARSILLDFPGFGVSPKLAQDWGSADYADHVAKFVKDKTDEKIIWVGHSYGGRVGLRLGANHPDILAGLVLVAAAGVPRKRTFWAKQKASWRQKQFRFLRSRAASQSEKDVLEKRFGSVDYVMSQEIGMRDVFLNAVREDQTNDLHKIKASTDLIYGANDTETPVEIGQAIQSKINGSNLIVCPQFDHIGVLDRGRHQIALSIKEMLEGAQK